MKVSSIPENIRNTIIKVLSQVPQRVLLKYEDEMMDKPENIMIKKWFPQRDILCKIRYNIKKEYNFRFIVSVQWVSSGTL